MERQAAGKDNQGLLAEIKTGCWQRCAMRCAIRCAVQMQALAVCSGSQLWQSALAVCSGCLAGTACLTRAQALSCEKKKTRAVNALQRLQRQPDLIHHNLI